MNTVLSKTVTSSLDCPALNLLTETQVADYLHVSIAALRKWRFQRRGPVFLKIGSLVRYRRADVEAWLSSCPQGGGRVNTQQDEDQTLALSQEGIRA
jgi:hypothetical protein